MARHVRPFNRQETMQDMPKGVGVLRLGWNLAEPDQTKKSPCTLPGFLVCTGAVDSNRHPQVDYPIMAKLGFKDEAAIRAVLANPRKWLAGSLPQDIAICIGYDAVCREGEWFFPGTFADDYKCYNKGGLFCHGDGRVAMRRQEDGSRKAVPCRVRGCSLKPGEQHCPYSVRKECKPHGVLVVRMMHFDKGRYSPMISGVPNMTWQVQTGSDYGLADIADELERVAEALAVDTQSGRIGWLRGLCGTLSVRRERHLYDDNGTAKQSITPQLHLRFDEGMVIERQNEIRAQRMAERGMLLDSPVKRRELAHVVGVPTADELNEPVEDVENEDETLGHEDTRQDAAPQRQKPAHDPKAPMFVDKGEEVPMDAEFEREPEPEQEPPKAEDKTGLWLVMAGELTTRCEQIARETGADFADVLEFYTWMPKKKRGLRGGVEYVFGFADDPKVNAAWMEFLEKCHKRAVVDREPYTPKTAATTTETP